MGSAVFALIAPIFYLSLSRVRVRARACVCGRTPCLDWWTSGFIGVVGEMKNRCDQFGWCAIWQQRPAETRAGLGFAATGRFFALMSVNDNIEDLR